MINSDGTMMRPQGLPHWERLSNEEKVVAIAKWVLNKYREAFEELAK